jgi:predicted transglutaminase-like cysteine proteinase
MIRKASSLLGAVSAFVAAVPAWGQQVASTSLTPPAPQPFMRVYGPSTPPYGFVRFCEGHLEDCAPQRIGDVRFDPSAARMEELDRINRSVNAMITPDTDQEIYGVSEFWTYPVDRGDCEDYALLKQKLLVERGWPKSSLLLTVVRDEKGEGHAVLTARTSEGDFVLDNKVDDIKMWSDTGYYYVMRQSYLDPQVWVSLDANDRRVAEPVSVQPPQPVFSQEQFVRDNPLQDMVIDLGPAVTTRNDGVVLDGPPYEVLQAR